MSITEKLSCDNIITISSYLDIRDRRGVMPCVCAFFRDCLLEDRPSLKMDRAVNIDPKASWIVRSFGQDLIDAAPIVSFNANQAGFTQRALREMMQMKERIVIGRELVKASDRRCYAGGNFRMKDQCLDGILIAFQSYPSASAFVNYVMRPNLRQQAINAVIAHRKWPLAAHGTLGLVFFKNRRILSVFPVRI